MKKTAVFLAAAVLAQALAVPVWAYPDTDKHWSKEFVELLTDKGIVAGTDGMFRPDDQIMADEFIKMAVTAMGYEIVPGTGYWASPYLAKAKELGLIYDDEATEFNRSASRGEIVRIAVRALGLDPVSETERPALIGQISDYYDILNEYKEYVLAAYKSRLINGYGDNSFRYDQPMTRAEACVVITRMLKIKPMPDDTAPTIDTDSIYFVAADGNDANDGSKDAPFKTIEKARDTVRQIIAAGQYPAEGITVYLRGGEYRIENTLTFTEQDSGTDVKPVVYSSYPGEVARLTGGVSLPYDQFTPAGKNVTDIIIDKAAAKNVLQIDLKKQGITDYGQLARRGYLIAADVKPQMELYIDGSRQQLARWPNTDWVGTTEIVRSGARSKSGVMEGAVFKIDYDRPTKWKNNINEIYTAGVLGENYFYGYFPIEKIEPGQITLKEGAVKDYYSKHFIRYENILEELDAPGEYYVDRENGMLYFYPPAGFGKDTDIRVSMMTDNMVQGTNVKNFRFENIKLDSTRSTGMRFDNAQNLLIKNCEVSGTGVHGISVTGTNCRIENNLVHDIGSNGISITGGDYGNIGTSGDVVRNNHIYKAAQIERSYQCGLMIGYQSVGVIAEHNEIHDMPHTGVIMYGPEHQLRYNNIYDCVKEYHDMDAIYMNVNQFPWERGVTVQQNFIHDLGKQNFTERQMNVAGIRTDNQGNGLNVIENVFYNIGYENSNQIRSVCAEGIENVIKNNIFVDVAETYDGPDTFDPTAKWDITADNVKTIYADWQKYSPKYSEKYPEVAHFYEHHHKAYEKSNVFQNNLIVNIKLPLSTLNAQPSSQGFRASEQLVDATGNLVLKEDPGFVDYAGGNFLLKDDSRAYTDIPGFNKVEFDKMGLLKDTAVGPVK